MNVFIRTTVLSLCLPFFTNNYAQPKERTLVFSAIKGTVSKQDSVSLPAGTKPAQLISGDINAFRKLSSQNGKIIFVFTPAADFTGIARADAAVSDTKNKTTIAIHLSGLSTKGLEGENEAPLSQIAEVLGRGPDRH